MQLSIQNRNSDAALAQPTPKDLSGLGLPDGDSSRAEIVGSPTQEQLTSIGNLVEHLGAKPVDLYIVALAIFISRLTRQDVVDLILGGSELLRFNLEGDCSFRACLTQTANRRKADPELIAKSLEQQGALYEFWAEGDIPVSNAACALRLSTSGIGGNFKLASPSGTWKDAQLGSWLGYLFNLLTAAEKNPDQPTSMLPLWQESEARAFYAGMNSTRVEFSKPTSITQRFATWVQSRADATAVISTAIQYSYRELDALSTQLARDLIASGAEPNRAVAVCMERTADLPMALLAVLKSGAFYVPLDPHNPSLRLRGILEECNPVAVISDTRTAGTLRDALNSSAIPVLLADKIKVQTNAGESLPSEPAISELAYTIYTSGTTGKPKGVRITRRALNSFICAMIERSYRSTESDRTLAVAPISFDIATMDMFVPLCSGGTLVVASRSDALDPNRIAQLVRKYDITCLQATPATWRMLVSTGWSGKRDLKMLSGGEALPRELANELVALGSELWNCYGPTETTIYSAVNRIYAAPGFVPVGSPISNTSFYVMDKAGYPVPPGIPGELYIGGLGVSPGYVARPELTAQRFVPDRFGDWHELNSQKTVASLFCTGDLVRLVKNNEGNEFEFFGRLDHQVKLRGFRIELGEIESVLRTHSSLADAVVALREDTPGEPRLVAYVLSSGELGGSDQIGAAALREHAAKSLPEYMLPSVIVTLESYPLSNSGKIDRRALPVPESVPERIAPDLPVAAAPSGELETKLLRIFQEVLKNDAVGVTDNFFRFGGYSLLTVRLFSRIDREMHVRLPISLLFDAPTVRELAKVIQKGSAPSVIVPIRPQGRSAPIFIIQSYLLYGAMLDLVEKERPIFGVREMGDEKEPIGIEERARKFASEILNVYSNGPIYLAGWCAAGTLTVEIARQLRESGHIVGLVALFDAERPGFAPPSGIKAWFSRLWRKTHFHARRITSIPWRARWTYVYEAMLRNWDWAVESYYTAHYHSMLWLQKRLGVSLSEAAFNNVYASLSALKDYSVQPYPGRLSLFRAADVPDVAGLDETLGWGTIAVEGVDVNFVPGDHVSMFKKPHISNLATRLQSELTKSERGQVVRAAVVRA